MLSKATIIFSNILCNVRYDYVQRVFIKDRFFSRLTRIILVILGINFSYSVIEGWEAAVNSVATHISDVNPICM